MQYGIFSDIHGNLEALEAVLEAIKPFEVDKYACLGDVVGYGANPNECAAVVKEVADYVVVGNHDLAAIDQLDTSYFNAYAKRAIEWTTEQLSADTRSFLENMPADVVLDDIYLVHASPFHPLEFRYIMSEVDLIQAFDAMPRNVAFTAHSHVFMTFIKDHEEFYTRDTKLTLDTQAIVNVGSVGQPRDSDPKAVFSIFDSETKALEIHRVEYDIDKAANKILQHNLPSVLAERLYLGK